MGHQLSSNTSHLKVVQVTARGQDLQRLNRPERGTENVRKLQYRSMRALSTSASVSPPKRPHSERKISPSPGPSKSRAPKPLLTPPPGGDVLGQCALYIAQCRLRYGTRPGRRPIERRVSPGSSIRDTTHRIVRERLGEFGEGDPRALYERQAVSLSDNHKHLASTDTCR